MPYTQQFDPRLIHLIPPQTLSQFQIQYADDNFHIKSWTQIETDGSSGQDDSPGDDSDEEEEEEAEPGPGEQDGSGDESSESQQASRGQGSVDSGQGGTSAGGRTGPIQDVESISGPEPAPPGKDPLTLRDDASRGATLRGDRGNSKKQPKKSPPVSQVNEPLVPVPQPAPTGRHRTLIPAFN